jgi:hypothetical protein
VLSRASPWNGKGRSGSRVWTKWLKGLDGHVEVFVWAAPCACNEYRDVQRDGRPGRPRGWRRPRSIQLDDAGGVNEATLLWPSHQEPASRRKEVSAGQNEGRVVGVLHCRHLSLAEQGSPRMDERYKSRAFTANGQYDETELR